jgi:hypothetical protein
MQAMKVTNVLTTNSTNMGRKHIECSALRTNHATDKCAHTVHGIKTAMAGRVQKLYHHA